MREVDYPRRGAGLLDLRAPMRRCATRRRCGSPTTSSCTKTTSAWSLRDWSMPRVAGVDKSFASYEQALAHVTGPRLTRHNMSCTGNRAARRPPRTTRSLRPLRLLDPAPARTPRPADECRAGGSCRPAGSCAPLTCTAIPGLVSSTRPGTRPHGGFVESGFLHILRAPITCCSCSAW